MSTWADAAIEQLVAGKTATIHPRGNSMTPRIRSGQRVELAPLGPEDTLRRGDIVLVQMNARTVYLHYVRAVERDRVQIGNAHGRINGWAPRSSVYGRVSRIGD